MQRGYNESYHCFILEWELKALGVVSCVVDAYTMMGLYQTGIDRLIRVKCFLPYYAAYT